MNPLSKINDLLCKTEQQYDMIIITDSEGTIQLYNNFLSQLCNSANKDELLLNKVRIDELFKPENDDFQLIWKTLEDTGSFSGILNFKIIYNQLIPFDVKALRMSDESHDKFKYLFVFKLKEISDIEKDPLEQKEFYKLQRSLSNQQENLNIITSLDELERLKEDFLSNVSHELRTPLASIIGFAETLKNDPDLPSEIRHEFLDIILNEGKRLAATINDLLDLSQLYRNSMVLQPQNIELQKLLLKSFEEYKQLATKIEFTIHLPEKPIFIIADANKLQQAVNNLLSNAIKFTPENGKVSLKLHESNEYYIIEVSDTGLGIPDKDKEKIYDRFYKVHRPGLETKGVGIGLSITKKIIDLHKFELEFESEENKGSSFRILIPKSYE